MVDPVNRRIIGLRKSETVRQVAGTSVAAFILIVLVAGFPAFLEGFDTNLYFFGSPFILDSVKGALIFLGLIGTGFSAGLAIFSLVGGFLFDKFSVKYVVMIAVSIFAVFTLLTGFPGNLADLFVYRFMVGVGVGMFQPAGVALLGDLFFETRGRAVAVWAMFFGVGLFLGPLVMAPFLPLFSTPFIISGIIGLFAILIFFLVIPNTYKKVQRVKVSIKGLFNRNVIMLSISILAYGVAQFGFLSYFSDYLLKVLLIPSGKAALITSMEGIGGFICAVPIGMAADRFGRKYLVIFAAAVLLLGTVGIWLLTTQVTGFMVYTFLYGAGWGVYVDLLVALVQDSVQDNVVGSISGWMFFIFNIGTLFGGPIFGLLAGLSFRIAGIYGLIIPTTIAFLMTLGTKKVTKSNIAEKPAFLAGTAGDLRGGNR